MANTPETINRRLDRCLSIKVEFVGDELSVGRDAFRTQFWIGQKSWKMLNWSVKRSVLRVVWNYGTIVINKCLEYFSAPAIEINLIKNKNNNNWPNNNTPIIIIIVVVFIAITTTHSSIKTTWINNIYKAKSIFIKNLLLNNSKK